MSLEDYTIAVRMVQKYPDTHDSSKAIGVVIIDNKMNTTKVYTQQALQFAIKAEGGFCDEYAQVLRNAKDVLNLELSASTGYFPSSEKVFSDVIRFASPD